MIKILLDFIYPSFCIVCQKHLDLFSSLKICKTCYKNLPWIKNNCSCITCGRFLNYKKKINNICSICKNENIFFNGGISLFNFFNPLNKELYKIKYYGDFTHISTFSNILAKRLKKIFNINSYIISYVSLHSLREKERGFNQSFLIAKYIKDKLNLPLEKLLIRNKMTKPQVSLNFKERKVNIKNSFSFNPYINKIPENVILIDDVLTSGSTLNECSKVLKEKGIKNIFIATIFSVPDEY